jgi:hypothetical protein
VEKYEMVSFIHFSPSLFLSMLDEARGILISILLDEKNSLKKYVHLLWQETHAACDCKSRRKIYYVYMCRIDYPLQKIVRRSIIILVMFHLNRF